MSNQNIDQHLPNIYIYIDQNLRELITRKEKVIFFSLVSGGVLVTYNFR